MKQRVSLKYIKQNYILFSNGEIKQGTIQNFNCIKLYIYICVYIFLLIAVNQLKLGKSDANFNSPVEEVLREESARNWIQINFRVTVMADSA